MGTYREALAEYYNGEVLGEAAYSTMLTLAESDDQRLKLGTLLQLETETKAWLRPHVLANGVSLEERAQDRETGATLAGQLSKLSWPQKWQAFHTGLSKQVVPRYRALADEAASRGNAKEEAVCRYMVAHEEAQVEFARRELAGEDTARVLEPVLKYLKYPLTA